MEIEPHCAHQPEYTLPCPLEVYQQPLKYRYLHITDTQRQPQWCPLLHCVHLELHFARYLLTVLFRASAHGCSQLKRQKLRVGDCAEGLKWFNYPLASAHLGCKVSCQGGTELTCIVSLSVLRRSQPNTYIACCQVSTAFSCRLQYANFMLQGKNAVNEATEGVCKPDVVVPKAHQKNHRYACQLSGIAFGFTMQGFSMVDDYPEDLDKQQNSQNWGVGTSTGMGACPGQYGNILLLCCTWVFYSSNAAISSLLVVWYSNCSSAAAEIRGFSAPYIWSAVVINRFRL